MTDKLLARIKEDQLRERKSRLLDGEGNGMLKISLLTTIIGEAETTLKSGKPLDMVALLKKFYKNMEISLAANYTEAVHTEMCIVSDYLPKQLTEVEIKRILRNENIGNLKNFMIYMKTNHAGTYDGKLASTVSRAHFS